MPISTLNTHIRYNKSFEMKKRINMVNPQDFLTEYYNNAKNKDRSVYSDISKTNLAVSNYHSSQNKRKKRKHFISCEKYGTIEYKQEKQISPDDLNINERKTSHTNHTHSIAKPKVNNNTNNNNNQEMIINNYRIRRDILLFQIDNYKKEKKALVNRKMVNVINDKTMDLLVNDIKKYKTMAENCKHTFIELSYQINTLKKEINKVKKTD